MTNLLAAVIVTFSTNVTERFPTHWVEVYPDLGNQYQYAIPAPLQRKEVPDKDPHQKFVHTVVTKHTASTTQTGPRSFSTEQTDEVVSDTEQEFAIHRVDSWEPGKITTNQIINPAYWHTVLFTNSGVVWATWATNEMPYVTNSRSYEAIPIPLEQHGFTPAK